MILISEFLVFTATDWSATYIHGYVRESIDAEPCFKLKSSYVFF